MYGTHAMFNLFDNKDISTHLDFNFTEESNVFKGIKKLSISGAQEKYSAVIDNGIIRIASEGEQGTHILKPAPVYPFQYRSQMPANEYLTMQIANEIYGIETAKCGICYTTDKKPVFITERFDIVDGKKIMQEDFASILGKISNTGNDNYKYEGSYFDIAQAMAEVVQGKEDALLKFLKLVIFNYLFANGDAHLKNFSVLYINGIAKLAPAYDLVNTGLHVNDEDFALSNGLGNTIEKSEVYLRTGHPCKEDFLNFSDTIGIERTKGLEIIKQFEFLDDSILKYIENSDLDEKPRRIYKSIIVERHKRYIRQ